MARYTEINFEQAVNAGSSVNVDSAISLDTVNIHKVKLTPAGSGGIGTLKIYKAATRLAASLCYETLPSSSAAVDPTDTDGNEVNEGFVAPYEDLDAGGQMHLVISNSGESNETYTVSILYEPNPPAHVHAESEITNLVDDLAGKSDTGHGHAQSDITGLVDALAGKVDVFDFTTIPHLKCFIRPTLGITMDGSEVSQAADQSGNNNHWNRKSGAAGPTIASAALNGHDVFQFASAASRYLKCDTLGTVIGGTSRPFMMFLVCKQTTSAYQDVLHFMDSGGYNVRMLFCNANGFWQVVSDLTSTQKTAYTYPITSGWNLWTIFTTDGYANNLSMRCNGKTIVDRQDWNHSAVTRTCQYATLGTHMFGTNYSSLGWYLDGQVADFLLLDNPLTEPEMIEVEKAIANYYALIGCSQFPYMPATPTGSVINIYSGWTYNVKDIDHHIECQPETDNIIVQLPTLDRTVAQREYIVTCDKQINPSSTKTVTIKAATGQYISCNGIFANTIILSESHSSVFLKGCVNYSANWYWQVVGTTPATAVTIGTLVNGLTTKASPVAADQFAYMDSEASNILKKLSGDELKAWLKAYLDTVYSPLPTWGNEAYDAAKFSASGSMTWTVAEADVTTYRYFIQGNLMTVWFCVKESTVGGTPDNALKIKIPASKTCALKAVNVASICDNGGWGAGQITVNDDDTWIEIRLISTANWSAATDTTYVYGQITFEIQ
jgi:hypothetical protein